MSADPTFDELWNTAVENYVKATGRTPEERAILNRLHNAEDLYNQLDTDSRRFGGFRNKHARFYHALKSSVRPFVLLSGVVSTAISFTPFAPASTILGAVVFLVNAAGGVSDSYDWIEQLFDKLSGFTQRLEEYIDGGMRAHLREKVIAILVCLLEILARSEQVMKSGRIKKYAAVLFLGQDEEVNASFSKLTKLFEDEDRLVSAVSYATNQRIEKKTDEIDKTTKQTLEAAEGVQKQLEELAIDKRSSEQKALLDEHLLTSGHKKNVAICNEYYESTIEKSGEWLLSEENVTRWIGHAGPLLWVSGGPGTGKSCLSSRLISNLRDTYPQDPAHPNRTSVAYFYIKEHDQDLQDLSTILKSLSYQITQVDSVYRNYVLGVLSRPDPVATPRKLWENLFLDFFRSDRDLPNAAMIVLDGLDEAAKKTIKELFVLLEDLADPSRFGTRLSWAFFSRPELAEFLEPKFSRVMAKVEIGNKNEGDIAQYIKARITDVLVVKQSIQLKNKKAAAKLARDIRDKIMAKADGMFFKVVLIMDQIYEKERVNSVFEAIEEAPPQLEAMIAHVFEKLTANEDVDKADLNELLLWVSFAKRELHVAELYAVLKVRTGQAYDALESRLRGKFASIFKLTGPSNAKDYQMADEQQQPEPSAVEDIGDFDIDDLSFDDGDADDVTHTEVADKTVTQQESSSDGLSKETVNRFRKTRVRFTHASIRDFLVQSRSIISLDTHTGPAPILVDPRTADMHIAKVCMQRIISYGADHASKPDRCDFLAYASDHFADHLAPADSQSLSENEKQSINRQICQLFHSPPGLEGLIRATFAVGLAVRSLHTFFEHVKIHTVIRTEWLKSAVEADFSSEEWEWIQASVDSPKELFRPLATQASKMWLTKNGNDDVDYCDDRLQVYLTWIIFCWLKSDESATSEVQSLDVGRFHSSNPPAYEKETFEKLTEVSQIEQTAHWYTAYGWLLMKADQMDVAKEYYGRALDIDKHSWKSLQGLSIILAHQEQYDEATARLNEALRVVPEKLKTARASIRSYLLGILIGKEDYAAAVKLGKEVLEIGDDGSLGADIGIAAFYILALHACQEYSQILDVVQDISKLGLDYGVPAFLGLHDFHHEIGRVLWTRGLTLSIAKPWIDSVFDPGRGFDFWLPWMAAWLAEFMYFFYPEVESSLECFERLASARFKAQLNEEIRPTFEESIPSIESFLAEIYYQKAMGVKKAGQDPSDWVSKLKNLAIADQSNSGDNPTYKINNAALMLCTYLRRDGAEKAAWKPCIRHAMLEAIDMLGDDDPLNDVDAYCMLIDTLIAAGDTKDAGAAAAVVFMPDSVSSNPELVEKLKAIGFVTKRYECDGPCTSPNFCSKERYKEMHFCLECRDTTFCEDCLVIAKKGGLPYRKCSPDHEFVQFLPVPEEAKDVAAKFVDGKTMEVNRDWLDALRKEWC